MLFVVKLVQHDMMSNDGKDRTNNNFPNGINKIVKNKNK